MRHALAAIGPALVLVALAIWEIVATVRAERSVPGPDGWARAEQVVRAAYQPGDLIVFAPGWIDPVGREHLGDLIPVEAAARMDADRYAVIWEVSIRGARAPETRGLAAQQTASAGGVTVRRFERRPVTVVADLVSLAGTIQARGAIAQAPREVLAEVGFAPHRCVQVVPQPGGEVTLDYGDLSLGSTLVGYVGLADVFTRRDVRDPGRLVVRIDGTDEVAVTAGVDDGWRRFEVPTAPGPHHVELVAAAIGPKARDRRICVAAEARW